MLRVNSATRNLAANAEFAETPGEIPPPFGRRDDTEFSLFYKAAYPPLSVPFLVFRASSDSGSGRSFKRFLALVAAWLVACSLITFS